MPDSKVLTITVMYGSASLACRLLETLERLCGQFERPVKIDWRLWRTDIAQNPGVIDRVYKDAMSSQALALAPAGESDLGTDLIDLVETWCESPEPSQGHRLVVLSNVRKGGTTHQAVRDLAKRKGIELIFSETPEPGLGGATVSRLNEPV